MEREPVWGSAQRERVGLQTQSEQSPSVHTFYGSVECLIIHTYLKLNENAVDLNCTSLRICILASYCIEPMVNGLSHMYLVLIAVQLSHLPESRVQALVWNFVEVEFV